MSDDVLSCQMPADGGDVSGFASELVDRVRAAGNVWNLRGGQVLLPEVFGFCQGVKRALAMLQEAVARHVGQGGRLFLLGQIIHNPWVNRYFKDKGVAILTPEQVGEAQRHITAADCAVIPAFGVPLPVEQQLRRIGCRVVDTSCGDVRRLWRWADQAVRAGHGVLIYGRSRHDETLVTKSRLAAVGGSYLVVGNLDETRVFCDLVAGRRDPSQFRDHFGPEATNAGQLSPFLRLAQISQTTMLYDETLAVRELVRQAYAERFGPDDLGDRLAFQPTVCRATQARQSAAVQLCRRGCDLVVVVGGFGSSNTLHLYELARSYAAAWFIEDAGAIRSAGELETIDLATNQRCIARDWLPARRPLRIGLLAGASCPEIVVGEVLQRLGELLG